MTTKITKYNYNNNSKIHEVIDRTRRGHNPPKVVLNPIEFSKMAAMANPQDEMEEEFVRPNTRHKKVTDGLSDDLKGKSNRKLEASKVTPSISSDYQIQEEMGNHDFVRPNTRHKMVTDGFSDDLKGKFNRKLEASKVTPSISSVCRRQDDLETHLTKESGSVLDSDRRSSRATLDLLSGSNSDDYKFPGLEHTPEMKQLLELRKQLHAMKLQTKELAESHKELTGEYESKPKSSHYYTRWNPKLLFEDLGKRNYVKPKSSIQKQVKDEIQTPEEDQDIESGETFDSPNAEDTYSKAVFQRGGEFQPINIRKRNIFSKTYLLKGDGYDNKERGKWIQKQAPEYIKTYEVPRSDERYLDLDNLQASISDEPPFSMRTSSTSSSKMGSAEKESVPYKTNKSRNLKSRSKSATDNRERQELPHQRHHDFRKLKNIFSQSRPSYDRLKRDRETLTQMEKETLKLKFQENQKAIEEYDEAVSAAECQLKIKHELSPHQRSQILLKQVTEGRIDQLEEKARKLQNKLEEERKWDRKVILQQHQHLKRLKEKQARKEKTQRDMRKALNKLVAERKARDAAEKGALEAERKEKELHHLNYKRHHINLLQQEIDDKQEKLRQIKEDLEEAKKKHDERDLHYAVCRKKEYRNRKRERLLTSNPSEGKAPSLPHMKGSVKGRANETPHNASFFNVVNAN